MPLVVWNRRPDSQTSEAGFWHQLLLASHFEFAHPTKPPKKAEGIYLCKQRYIALANNAKNNYVMLIIDEAQDITFRRHDIQCLKGGEHRRTFHRAAVIRMQNQLVGLYRFARA